MKHKIVLSLVLAVLTFSCIGCGADDAQNHDTQKEKADSEITNDLQTEITQDTSSEMATEEVSIEDELTEDVEETEMVMTESESSSEPETPTESDEPSAPPSESSTENTTDDTQNDEVVSELPPFEGIYWYLNVDMVDFPKLRKGMYFDGTKAYYYQENGKIYEYEYELVNTEEDYGRFEVAYTIQLYSNGEPVKEEWLGIEDGLLGISLYFGREYGGGVFYCEKVESFEGLFD